MIASQIVCAQGNGDADADTKPAKRARKGEGASPAKKQTNKELGNEAVLPQPWAPPAPHPHTAMETMGPSFYGPGPYASEQYAYEGQSCPDQISPDTSLNHFRRNPQWSSPHSSLDSGLSFPDINPFSKSSMDHTGLSFPDTDLFNDSSSDYSGLGLLIPDPYELRLQEVFASSPDGTCMDDEFMANYRPAVYDAAWAKPLHAAVGKRKAGGGATAALENAEAAAGGSKAWPASVRGKALAATARKDFLLHAALSEGTSKTSTGHAGHIEAALGSSGSGAAGRPNASRAFVAAVAAAAAAAALKHIEREKW